MPALTQAQASALLATLPMDPPFVEVFLNGMYTTLFLFTTWSLYTHPRKAFRRRLWIPVMFVLWTCATIHSAIEWRIPAQAFQYHGATPDIITYLTHPAINLRILGGFAVILSLLIPDAIMIWRCWVVWGRKWWVVVLPILATIAGMVCAALSLAAQIAVSTIPNTTTAQRLAPLARFGLPFFSCSLATTLYTTILIIVRIYLVRRSSVNMLVGHESGALSYALEILIESSFMYAVSLSAYVALLSLKNENQVFTQNINVQIAGIAPTLLVYRISLGHARQVEEWKAPVSVLRFATLPGSATRTNGTGSMGNTTVYAGHDGFQSREGGLPLPKLGKKASKSGSSNEGGFHGDKDMF